jgi:GT2 family glycosyltransferase/2-polyprenyl-3-methyl-5-hydroxy-6-metoxy-1,4-benzoquinol methylase/glycosyltransferase involved in cell wall biosynthesis
MNQDEIPDLEWTGERYVPQVRGSIALEHLHRYAMASEFVQEKHVLDVACGEGYGSDMLARTAASVIGVDIDEKTITHAQKKYRRDNLCFKQGSCTKLPLSDNSIDIVVSFETIEHIAEHEKMLSEIKRILKPGGLLIISTPDKYEYTEAPHYHNQFHVKELYSDEFHKILEKYFKNLKILGQRVLYGSGIFEIKKSSFFDGVYDFYKMPEEIENQKGIPRPLYLISICSDTIIPKIGSSFCEQLLLDSDGWKEWTQNLEEREKQLLSKKTYLSKLQNELIEQEAQIIKNDPYFIQSSTNIDELQSFYKITQDCVNKLHTVSRNKVERKMMPLKIALSGLFDKKWYLENNTDVALNGEDPIAHYIHFGAQEGRDPHPNFNTKWYLENNPDVAQSALNPLYHYIKFGEKEGRATNPFSQQSKINGISKIKYIIESLISLKNKVELRITALFSHFCYWYTEKNPKVSIIILNYNNALFTLHCLKNIWKYTQGYYYEIIVVDNGSQLKDFETLSFFKGKCKLLRLEVNRYFGEGNNLGAELANGEFIVFMNNDVTVTKNWLPPLMKAFDDHSDCGVAGPKFIYPDGSLQEAGAFIQEDGTSLQIGKKEDPKTPKFNYEREVDYISAATILLRKEIFEQVLGFDFIYEPAYYEDVDLCLKISELGLKTYYIPQSCVVHHEHATAANPKNSLLLNNIVAINREKFVIRWKKYLKTREHNIKSYSKQLISYKEVKNKKKLTAAIFTPYNIIPGGGERYLLSIAEVLIGKGYEVWLVTPEKFSRLRIIKVADILGLNISSIKTTTYREAQKMPLFDLFIAMNNEVVPPVHAIGKKNFYCCQFPFPSPNKSIRERSAWLVDYQAIIVYSNFVKKHLWSLVQLYKLGEPKIHVMPPPVNMVSSSSSRLRKCIISVGRFFTGGHCKQQDFLINSFRKIYLSDSEIELHLVGSLHVETEHREYFLKCQKLAEGLPVYFHQDASSDILERLYATSSVYWHAAGFGVDETKEPEKCEHFGISVVEAMSAGIIPIVFSNGGPAEIIKSNYNGFHYDSEEALIKITQEIFTKPENELLEIRKQARIRANDFNKNAFKKLLIELIKIT